MDKVILYTTDGCPKCNLLKRTLNNKKIDFKLIEGEETILKKGFRSAPLLEVDGKVMLFVDAIKWAAGR